MPRAATNVKTAKRAKKGPPSKKEQLAAVSELFDDAVSSDDSPEALAPGSKFVKQYEKLRKLADSRNNDFEASAHAIEMYRTMLSSTLALIPIAESKYRASKGESAAYAYNALVNAAKDCSSQIQSMTDNSLQADHINNNIVGPIFVMIAQSLLTQLGPIKAVIDSNVKDTKAVREVKGALDKMLRDFATYLNEASESTTARIKDYLDGGRDGFAVKIQKGKAANPRSKKAASKKTVH